MSESRNSSPDPASEAHLAAKARYVPIGDRAGFGLGK